MSKSRKKKKTTPARKFPKTGFILAGLAAILLLTYSLYAPSLDNAFINLDDTGYVAGNPYIHELTAKNLGNIFTKPVAGYYHPVTLLSLAFDYQSAGTEPHTYHLHSLWLHLANTLLVFFFIYLLSDRKWIAALFTALFFAIHPMHVESVAWVAQRKDLLYTFFFLPSLISYLYYVRGRSRRYYWFSLVLFILSLASKPTAGILPFVLLLIDYFEGRKWEWKLLTEKIPFFVLALFAAILTVNAQAQIFNFVAEHSFLEKILYSCYGMLEYGVKSIVPIHLSAFHPYPMDGEPLHWMYIAAPFVVLAAALLVYFFARKNKPLAFGLIFFVLTLLLALQVISPVSGLTAERYTYLPYIGLLFPIGILLEKLVQRKKGRSIVPGIVAGVIVLGAAYLFSAWTNQRAKVWKNSITIWSDVIKKYPDTATDAYINRGLAYLNMERTEEALQDYNRAIEMDPQYHLPFLNRGTLMLSVGNLEQALEDLNKGIELEPEYDKGYINRAGVYLKMEKFDAALKDYDKALEIKPDIAQIHYLRGYARLSLNKRQEALEDLNKAIEINDGVASYFLYRSYTHNSLGNYREALEDAQKAQRMGQEVKQEYLDELQNQ